MTYVLKQNNELYLIHSNYLDSVQVVIELMSSSEVFQSFSKYYIVSKSTNKELLKLWASGKELEIRDNG